jgi:hypothetical protein
MPMKLSISAGALCFLLATIAPVYAQREQQEKEQGRPQQGQQHQQEKAAQPQHQQEKSAQPQRQQEKAAQPERQQEKAAQPQPQRQQEKAAQPPPQRQQEKAAQPQRQQQASRPAPRPQQSYGGVYHGGVQPTGPTYCGVHPSGVPQHQGQVRSGFGQSRAASWNNDHRSWGQRGGYNGYRVPDDRFRLYFGSNHFFRINRLPTVFVGGYPRFQYDGYWVTFVDPWPETWSPTWYETDDVYIDYADDGYYVYDRMHPGIGIAVSISF